LAAHHAARLQDIIVNFIETTPMYLSRLHNRITMTSMMVTDTIASAKQFGQLIKMLSTYCFICLH